MPHNPTAPVPPSATTRTLRAALTAPITPAEAWRAFDYLGRARPYLLALGAAVLGAAAMVAARPSAPRLLALLIYLIGFGATLCAPLWWTAAARVRAWRAERGA